MKCDDQILKFALRIRSRVTKVSQTYFKINQEYISMSHGTSF